MDLSSKQFEQNDSFLNQKPKNLSKFSVPAVDECVHFLSKIVFFIVSHFFQPIFWENLSIVGKYSGVGKLQFSLVTCFFVVHSIHLILERFLHHFGTKFKLKSEPWFWAKNSILKSPALLNLRMLKESLLFAPVMLSGLEGDSCDDFSLPRQIKVECLQLPFLAGAFLEKSRL